MRTMFCDYTGDGRPERRMEMWLHLPLLVPVSVQIATGLRTPGAVWENVLWLLLKVRDTQVGSTEKSAMDLSLESALTKAWEKPSYDFVAEATRILEVVASSCVFMHFAHMHCL